MKNINNNCLFCNIPSNRIISENKLAYVIFDKYPVTKFHSLIIPKRHFENYFDIDESEIKAVNDLLFDHRNKILEEDNSVTGFNIGVNSGKDAGQTIMHCHIHLIPRRKDDVKDPEGGVRGVIRAKQSY